MRQNGSFTKRIVAATTGIVLAASTAACFREDKRPDGGKDQKKAVAELPTSELNAVATRRGLTDADLLAAVQTFTPTGGRDEYLSLVGTGTGGRVAVFGMPSMRILKYAGVFTPEAWQGYAYDDQSRALIEASGREDIQYSFGDLGLPALTLTAGRADGTSAFLVDAANARVAVFALDDYETKQIVVNPIFRGSFPALATTPNSEFIVQTTAAPELPGGTIANGDVSKTLRGGASFWRLVRSNVPDGAAHGFDRIHYDGSFTVELPPYLQSRPVTGRGKTADLVFIIGRCKAEPLFDTTSACAKGEAPSVLHVINWRTAVAALRKATKIRDHAVLTLGAVPGVLAQVDLPAGSDSLALSADGSRLAVTSATGGPLLILDATRLAGLGGTADAFGVPTVEAAGLTTASVAVGGPTSGAAFSLGDRLYATAIKPGRLLRIDAGKGTVLKDLELGYEPAGLLIPGAETVEASEKFAVVMNKRPQERMVSVGPIVGLQPQLIDISGESLRQIYDMSLPQATSLLGVAYNASLVKTVVRYKSGTDPRSGEISPVRTVAGQEKIIRDGKRVHVFATLVRSHITPELVEVEEGDTVSFHITNLEQAQDQTHGFTIGTYNVHGSWEPGKTASVTFVANRPGVFPYYCTEFCSALHLEMEGYLLVKPKGWKPAVDDVVAAVSGSSDEDKVQFEAKMQAIKDTQAVIDSVVTWLKDNKYESDPRAVELVTDALTQLEQTKSIQAKIDAAVGEQNWSSARLWAEQVFQYQVKAADAGLRAKKVISEAGGGQ